MAKKGILRRASKPKEVEITEEEMVKEAEAQGMLDHNEAEQILEEDQMKFDEVGMEDNHTADGDEADVKRPELKAEKQKPKFEQPGTNNQSRKVETE